MTGKLADTVMTVRNGEQIARKYQPIVANPNTPAQIEARAKLKMFSQLSAVLGPYIAIPSEGPVSSRNLFVKDNYHLATYADNTASVDLNNVQLTKSVVGMDEIGVTRTGYTLNVNLGHGDATLDRVIYVAVLKLNDNRLRVAGSAVVQKSAGLTFPGTIDATTLNEVVVYAYGIRDNTEAARAVFGNITAVSAEQVAKLIVTRSLTAADITMTETRAVTVTAGNPE